jgi:hypothetical protein
MTRFVGTPLRGIEFSTVSDETFSVRVNGDNYARVRIDAGGRLNWSSGSATFDTNLFRDSANMLQTDDAFKAALGIVTLTTIGVPSAVLPDGAIAIDTQNDTFYFRSNSLWQEISGGGALSGDVDGGDNLAEILEAEVTNYVIVEFDGEEL